MIEIPKAKRKQVPLVLIKIYSYTWLTSWPREQYGDLLQLQDSSHFLLTKIGHLPQYDDCYDKFRNYLTSN